MLTEPGEPVEVLSGTDQDLSTMLHVYRGDRLLGASGFGGPNCIPVR